MIANFEDNRRESVGLFFDLSPPRFGKTAMPFPRRSPIAPRPVAVRRRNYRGCKRLAFSCSMVDVDKRCASACDQHSLDELGARS